MPKDNTLIVYSQSESMNGEMHSHFPVDSLHLPFPEQLLWQGIWFEK